MSTEDNIFAVGDVVRLRSGGAAMTIGYIQTAQQLHGIPMGQSIAECYWLDENGEPCSFKFPFGVLMNH